jgi:catechol 2,3-dioxygenase-like lactoylglutathione lyase family enzyme
MQVRAATIGIPVTDLDRSVAWYRGALELGEPDLVPVPGVVEFDLGACWLQLTTDPVHAGASGISLNLSVPDAGGERARMAAAGLRVSELTRFDGVLELFELTDPDGNTIGFVTELSTEPAREGAGRA